LKKAEAAVPVIAQCEPFMDLISNLPPSLREILRAVPASLQADCREIRLRAGRPIALTLPGGTRYLTGSGRVSALCQPHYDCLTAQDLEEALRALCGYSVHSFTEAIAQGFIPLPGGHRAGVAGTAGVEQGRVVGVRAVSSLNLRVARDVPGVAAELAQKIFEGGHLRNLLILGEPGSGKTTVLRDLARILGDAGRRVALVDERGELAGVRDALPSRDVGVNTDVLSGYPKAEGILIALRGLAPDVVICDELGAFDDVAAIAAGAHAGVAFVCSAHAGSEAQAVRRPVIKKLLDDGIFDALCQLSGAETPGKILRLSMLPRGADDSILENTCNTAYSMI
jgi:stage III sporulation protein AA